MVVMSLLKFKGLGNHMQKKESKFKLGMLVKIISGEDAGKTGNITFPNGDLWLVNIKDGKKDFFHESELAPVKPRRNEILVNWERQSVSMGDDAMAPHFMQILIPENLMLSEMLNIVIGEHYFPNPDEVAWVVFADSATNDSKHVATAAYIYSKKRDGEFSVIIPGDDIPMKLLQGNKQNILFTAAYKYKNDYTWKEKPTDLLEAVKKRYSNWIYLDDFVN
jgi:hypothetical protein